MLALTKAEEIMRGLLIGEDKTFTGVSIDSRTSKPGDLFFAILGERDGHNFVAHAEGQGAIGAVVDQVLDLPISQVKVEDTTVALGKLAQSWRDNFDIPVFGVTGSNGKTTVVAMLREILSISGNPLYPEGSFNNQWGVPLTLLDLNENHTHAIIEMGMNHPGEIDYLSQITCPNIVLINNAAAAHLEGLGSIEQVAAAKAEIINGARPDATVILNADDPFYDFWKQQVGERKVISFAIKNTVNPETQTKVAVFASEIEHSNNGSNFLLNVGAETKQINLPLPGQHNIANALAAATLAMSGGANINDIAKGLEQFKGVPGRLRKTVTHDGVTVIDDSFNANPESTKAAIDVLASYAGKRILILGAMAELGANAEQLHQEIGQYAANAGIEKMLVLAEGDKPGVNGYKTGYGDTAEQFNDLDSLHKALAEQQRQEEDVAILVKGSKSSYMGRVVKFILSGNSQSKLDGGAH